ncbi:TetR/AcrR family transcriptional regulator [Fusibacter sp. JL216-2]|uniref:TetR/AcrR family transcriptional regulator n=1 Tax=Fusibacter sp. JL216-2 TaxID=3071453 RepID=UPI003D32E176
MPHQTFFNLPKEKQQRIIDVCIDEFAEKTYHNASISNIVRQSKIAKGSFYQYFEDKKDIFKYILKYMGDKKLAYYSEIIPRINEMDFFELLKAFYVSGVVFAKDHPKLTKIGNFVLKTDDEDLKKELMKESGARSSDFMSMLIKGAIERGELRSDIEIDFINHIIQSMSLSTIDYYYKKHDSLGEEEKDFIHLTHQMVDCLRDGLSGQ